MNRKPTMRTFRSFNHSKSTTRAGLARCPSHIRQIVLFVLSSFALCGCATFQPQPMDEAAFQQRAETQVENGVRVSAAVLSAAEAETMFGRPLYKKGIQPIWLEIENNTDTRLRFLPVSVDRDYFAPMEVAYLYHSSFSGETNDRIDRFFHEQNIGDFINPGQVSSGFVFTNLEMGTKAFIVDLISRDQQLLSFMFLIPVEGLQVDHREVDWNSLYTEGDRVEFDSLESLRRTLEALPCCTAGEDGAQLADPLNVVIIGDGQDVLYALLRSGWDETASTALYKPTAQLPWEFRYQPVNSLYLFDRPQDVAFRKTRSTLNERNQLRLWLSPYYYEGKHVWVGQISRIIRRSVWSRFIIEPDVDEARTYLLQDLWYAQALWKYGFVKGTGMATLAKPRKSLHDDTYFTDGLRVVIWVPGDPVSLVETRSVDWEKPMLERRKLMIGP